MTGTAQIRQQLVDELLDTPSGLSTSVVGRLGRAAATAMLGGQLALGERVPLLASEATVRKLVFSLGGLKAAAMKVGQALSIADVNLPARVRGALSALQTAAQPLPFSEVRRIVERELGAHAAELTPHMQSRPIGAGSIGQVHSTRLADGRTVAVKVQYPNVQRALARDFGPAAMGTRFASFIFAEMDLGDLMHEVRERFVSECDYLLEARAQQRLADAFAGHPDIAVPKVLAAFSSSRVLTTELATGMHLEEFLAGDPPQEARDRAGAALLEFFVGSLYRHGIYNSDAHPGNYLFAADGHVTVLDQGAAFAPAGEQVARLRELAAAVHANEDTALLRALDALGILRSQRQDDFQTARALMRSLFGPLLRDEDRVLEASDLRRAPVPSKKAIARLALPSEIFFLFRVRLGLTSVLARLGARANWHALESGHVTAGQAAAGDLPTEDARLAAAGTAGPRHQRPAGAHELDVILVDAGARKIQVIRELREITGLELAAVKKQLDAGRMVVAARLWRGEADALRARLEAVGAVIELVQAES